MKFNTFLVAAAFQTALALAKCTPITRVTHTFYGWPDNDPAGSGTAYNCGRDYKAGGIGTYSNPLTFASAPGEFDVCEIIYDPYTQKYLRMEDYCAQCTTDWESGIWHIDVWTGSSIKGGGQAQIQCENQLTPARRSQTIIRYPSADLEVDSKFMMFGLVDQAETTLMNDTKPPPSSKTAIVTLTMCTLPIKVANTARKSTEKSGYKRRFSSQAESQATTMAAPFMSQRALLWTTVTQQILIQSCRH